jgi:hypothetical protein
VIAVDADERVHLGDVPIAREREDGTGVVERAPRSEYGQRSGPTFSSTRR